MDPNLPEELRRLHALGAALEATGVALQRRVEAVRRMLWETAH